MSSTKQVRTAFLAFAVTICALFVHNAAAADGSAVAKALSDSGVDARSTGRNLDAAPFAGQRAKGSHERLSADAGKVKTTILLGRNVTGNRELVLAQRVSVLDDLPQIKSTPGE